MQGDHRDVSPTTCAAGSRPRTRADELGMSSSLQAFADESHRRSEYMICAATIASSDLTRTRTELRKLRLSGQRRLHFASEGDPRRKRILSAMGDLDASTRLFVASYPRQTQARKAILQRMVVQLREDGVRRLVLDSREGQDHNDRSAIHEVIGSRPQPAFEYLHQPSATEPLLWIPDAVAWAWGRGGHWRKRLETLELVQSVMRIEMP